MPSEDNRDAVISHVCLYGWLNSPECGRKLLLTVFRRLPACMPAMKPSISLFAVCLETGVPELGTPDPTEIRTLRRPFPKDAGERGCYRYLLEQMQATPDRARGTKAELEKMCRRQFHVAVESFEYCWREAIKVTGARWDRPGRRPR